MSGCVAPQEAYFTSLVYDSMSSTVATLTSFPSASLPLLSSCTSSSSPPSSYLFSSSLLALSPRSNQCYCNSLSTIIQDCTMCSTGSSIAPYCVAPPPPTPSPPPSPTPTSVLCPSSPCGTPGDTLVVPSGTPPPPLFAFLHHFSFQSPFPGSLPHFAYVRRNGCGGINARAECHLQSNRRPSVDSQHWPGLHCLCRRYVVSPLPLNPLPLLLVLLLRSFSSFSLPFHHILF